MTKRKDKKSAVAPESALQDPTETASTTPDPALMATSTRPRPNIKFAGRKTWDAGKRKVLNDPAPIDRFSDAGELISLPPADWQKTNRLFYHSDAATIARAFPHLYKLVKSK
jgi:hypothetical protein